MPRRETMAGALRKWRRANRGWIRPEHAPKLVAATLLAEALDAERASGKVAAATASAWRHAFAELERMADDAIVVSPTTDVQEDDDPDGLFSPRSDL